MAAYTISRHSMTKPTSLLYDSASGKAFVGDRVFLYKLDVGSLAVEANISIGDPTPCLAYWFNTSASPVNRGAGFSGTGNDNYCTRLGCTSSSNDCSYSFSQCRLPFFLSSCSGNIYYFLTDVDSTSFVSCSSVGQCQRFSKANLADMSALANYPHPKGWACGVSTGYPGNAASVTPINCPVWRLGPTPNITDFTSEADYKYFDSAVGVVTADTTGSTSTPMLYLMSSSEQARDVKPTVRKDLLSKRQLSDFDIACNAGDCAPGSYSSAYDSYIQQVAVYDNTAEHKNGLMARYFTAFALDPYVYFVFQECATSDCLAVKNRIARFCTTKYSGTMVPFNSYVKANIACGGSSSIFQDVLFSQMSPSLQGDLSLSSSKMLLVASTGTVSSVCLFTFGPPSNYGGSAQAELDLEATLDMAFAQTSPQECTVEHTPVAIDSSTLGASLLLYKEPNAAHMYSKLAVDIVNGHTVVLVGTHSGSLLRLFVKMAYSSLANSTIANVQRSVLTSVETSSPIRGLSVVPTSSSVLVLTDSFLSKVPLSNCSAYTTCTSCMAAMDAYCGWCVVENKCSERMACAAASSIARADAYSGSYWIQDVLGGSSAKCPAVASASPQAFPILVSAIFDVQTVNLPPPLVGFNYYCSFGAYGLVEAVLVSQVLSCSIPLRDLLVPSAYNESIVVAFAYGSSNTSTVPVDAILQISGVTTVTFYKCQSVTSLGCSGCTTSKYPCGWCIFDTTCQSQSSFCRAPADFLSTNATCPRATSVAPNVFHVGAIGNATQLVVSGSGFKSPQASDSYEASFSPSSSLASAKVKCAYLNSTALLCRTPFDSGASIDTQGVLARSMALTLNTQVLASGLPVTSYDCVTAGGGETTGDCGRCLSVNPSFSCGWCKKGTPADFKCTLLSACGSVSDWVAAGQGIAQCPKPSITSFSPSSGPINGGTQLTLVGKNFGRDAADIKSITVAGKTCTLNSYNVSAGIVKCTTTAGSAGSGSVSLTLISDVTADSSSTFTYSTPFITSVFPPRAPAAGGTIVAISGSGLDIGLSRSVLLNNVQCTLQSIASSKITCQMKSNVVRRAVVSADPSVVCLQIDGLTCAGVDSSASIAFSVVSNPTIVNIFPIVAPVGGGVTIYINGTNLNAAVQPVLAVYIHLSSTLQLVATVTCNASSSALMACIIPPIAQNTSASGEAARLKFTWDGFVTQKDNLTYHNNPFITDVSPNNAQPGDRVVISGQNLLRGGIPSVYIAGSKTTITEITDTFITTTAPSGNAEPGVAQDVVLILGNVNSTLAAAFTYASSSSSSSTLPIFIFPVIGVIAALFIALFILYRYKLNKKKKQENALIRQMNDLESQVVEVCKQGFAELQSGGTLVFSSHAFQPRPFGEFFVRVLFTHMNTHPPPSHVSPLMSEVFDRFSILMAHEDFVLTYVSTLEQAKSFAMHDRVHVASLLMILFQDNPQYSFSVLQTLLDDVIQKAIAKKNAKLLLRRTETVAEKMLTSWLTYGMYSYLESNAGRPLFNLFQALKIQIDKGPCDARTGAAMYTLNADTLLRQRIDFTPLKITAILPNRPSVEVVVNSCDTISQIKSKILDQAFAGIPFDHAYDPELLEVVDVDWPSKGSLFTDLDESSAIDEPGIPRMNTAAHYEWRDGKTVQIMYATHVKELAPKKKRGASKSKMHDPKTAYHIVQDDSQLSKIPSEVYLTYMMTVKGIIQPYVDDLFNAVFNSEHCPPYIKALFDFLDQKAAEHHITDPEVIHVWKNNSVPLRFWVNVIKNPEFFLDVHKTTTLNSCLTAVSQVFMDSCSVSEQTLGANSPANKHLYRSEVAKYKEKVGAYYENVRRLPPVKMADVPPRGDSAGNVDACKEYLIKLALDHKAAIMAALSKKGYQTMADDLATCLSQYESTASVPLRQQSKSPLKGEGYMLIGDEEEVLSERRNSNPLDETMFEHSPMETKPIVRVDMNVDSDTEAPSTVEKKKIGEYQDIDGSSPPLTTEQINALYSTPIKPTQTLLSSPNPIASTTTPSNPVTSPVIYAIPNLKNGAGSSKPAPTQQADYEYAPSPGNNVQMTVVNTTYTPHDNPSLERQGSDCVYVAPNTREQNNRDSVLYSNPKQRILPEYAEIDDQEQFGFSSEDTKDGESNLESNNGGDTSFGFPDS